MNKRKVKIENFRNIFTPSNALCAENKKNKKQNGNELILSHNNKSGGVVLLIGPNNSGKSNILDALEFSTIDLDEENIAQQNQRWNSYYPRMQSKKEAKIKFYSPDWLYTEEEKKQNQTIVSIDSFNNSDLYSVDEMSKSIIFQDIYWNEIIKNEYYKESWSKDKKEIFNILIIDKKMNEYLAIIILIYMNILLEKRGEENIKFSITTNVVQELIKTFDDIEESRETIKYLGNDNWLLKIVVESLEKPNVIRYEEKINEIKNDDLELDFSELNKFGEKFFSAIDEGIELKNKYISICNNRELPENMKIQNYEKIIVEINKKLNNISKKFNELYFSSSESYVFELKRKETYTNYLLCLSIQDEKDGNIPINLDAQSWGFKWFFNFFFNVFSNRKLQAGTIILIEEPAVNLHIEGQKKWMKFVRDFAEKNKITFVITTHSPFLIDSNRLDEIRIIYKDGKYCKINNYFSVNVVEDIDGIDSLESIKKSMTFQNMATILYEDKDTQFYLVEGIIDYAILTYFKKIDKKYSNLYFLPINGINSKNSNEDKRKSLLNELIKIYGSNAKIIVDSDEAGIKFEKSTKKYKTDIIVRQLSEIGKTDIESLFSKDDLKIIQFNKSKSASKALSLLSLSGNIIDIFSKETIDNFTKFLDLLLQE